MPSRISLRFTPSDIHIPRRSASDAIRGRCCRLRWIISISGIGIIRLAWRFTSSIWRKSLRCRCSSRWKGFRIEFRGSVSLGGNLAWLVLVC